MQMDNASGQTNQANPESSEGNEIQAVEVTTFEDAQVAPGYEMPMINTGSQLNNVESTHSIIEFLRRPALMLDKTLKNSEMTPLASLPQETRTQIPIFNYNMPFDLAKFGGKDQKISRFEYFKTDVVVKVTINANNMTSGRFWLCYGPIDQFVTNGNRTVNKHRAGVTSYPGVEMDIQINNSVEMVIPYLHWAEAMSITSDKDIQKSMATLYMFPLTPLRSQADYQITLQLWAWYDNITLVGPTTKAPNPKALSEEVAFATALRAMALKDPRTYKSIKAQLQIGEVPGPITQVASKVSAVANFASGLPLVGEVAKTVGWVSDLVGGVASIFGWSKPVSTQENCKLTNVPGFGFTHSEGVDTSLVLGLTSRNELDKPHNAFPSGVDEMDIEYVCRNPAVVKSAEWKKTDEIYTEMMGLDVEPYADDSVTAGGFKYYSVAPCDYIGSLFGLWRGTMCYRICVVKTAYHTGRLEISFVPNKFEALTATDDTTNTYRYILDITNEAEVIIKIPFFSEANMLPIADDFGFTGRLTVRPITKLHAPDVVSGSVDILVWKWMEDVTFAVPSADDVEPYTTPFAPETKVSVSMQISVANTVDAVKTVSFFEGSDSKRDKVSILSEVCGEVCDNLRYLTRASRFLKTSLVPVAGAVGLEPYDNLANDYVGFIGQIYRYARGGMNYKLFAADADVAVNSGMSLKSRIIFNRGVTTRTPEHITYPILNPVHEISIPFYSKYKRVPVVDTTGGVPGFNSVGQAVIPAVRLEIKNSKNALNLDIYRSAKDDFSYGVMIGPPMLRRAVPAPK